MYPAPFEYVRALTYEDAAALLQAYGGRARILAGGQSLIPMMNLRLARPEVLIDINHVGYGSGLTASDDRLHIPALTRQRALERLPLVAAHAPLLAMAAAHTGNIRVRSRGTIGGNLAHADPSSEISCAAVAADAVVDVAGPQRSRTVPARDLFVSDFTTSLDDYEVIRSVQVPLRPTGTGWGFRELARRAGEFAVVNAAALVTLDDRGECALVRLACGGVSDRILDLSEVAADALAGHGPDPERIAAAARAAASGCEPRDDHQASAGYRARVIDVVARRALEDAVASAGRSHRG